MIPRRKPPKFYRNRRNDLKPAIVELTNLVVVGSDYIGRFQWRIYVKLK